MGKRYFKVVIICFVIFAIIKTITNSEALGSMKDVSYYLSTISNIGLIAVLILSFIYLYRKYEK